MADINQVEFFDILGTKIGRNSCMTGSGVPSSTLTALVGMLYMDTESREIYTCISSNVKLTVTSLGYDISPVTTDLVLDLDPSDHNNLENFGYTDGEALSIIL